MNHALLVLMSAASPPAGTVAGTEMPVASRPGTGTVAGGAMERRRVGR
jgi:hypothetical protein